jgi:hypothetical protein
MKNEEIRRRILDLLVQTVGTDQPDLTDVDIAAQLNIETRIAQGNLQILQEAGYVDIEIPDWSRPVGIVMFAALSPKGEVLLRETTEQGASALPHARAILAVMEKQVASFGELYAPPYLIVQIEEQRQLVAVLEAQQAG